MSMKQLSGLDASFLYLESPEMPMHVGALHVFELPAGYKGKFAAQLRKHIALRLPLVPALRRKLAWMPLNLANPAWVDAEPDLREHIVEHKLPASARQGSGMPELEAAVARLHTVLLDRSKPLWKFHVFEGLAPGALRRKRVAMYTQLHHAAVDGQAAVALANAILDATPEPREIELKPSTRPKKFKLGMAEMLSGAVANQVQQLSQLVRTLPATVGTLSGAAKQAVASSKLVTGDKKQVSNLGLAPRLSMNASVTASRSFASISVPLHEVKALGRLQQATVNDVVLFLCSTALRHHLQQHGPLPRKSLIAAVPISLREKGDASADNQASMSLISLGTHLADPAKRLAHVKAATRAMKSTLGSVKSLLPTDFPSLGVPWLMEAAGAIYSRVNVADRMPPVANVTISNVPGPPIPLYMAGAKMLTNYPTSIVVHGVGLNITVQSYDQSLDFGVIACAKAVPEVRELADAIGAAVAELRELPEPTERLAPAAPAAPATLAGIARQVAGRAGRAIAKTAVDATPRSIRKPIASAVRGTRKFIGSDTTKLAARVVPQVAAKAVTQAVGQAVSQAVKTAASNVVRGAARARKAKS